MIILPLSCLLSPRLQDKERSIDLPRAHASIQHDPSATLPSRIPNFNPSPQHRSGLSTDLASPRTPSSKTNVHNRNHRQCQSSTAPRSTRAAAHTVRASCTFMAVVRRGRRLLRAVAPIRAGEHQDSVQLSFIHSFIHRMMGRRVE